MYSLKRYASEDDISELYRYIFKEPVLTKMPGQPIIRSKDEFANWLICQLHGVYHDLYLIYNENQVKGYLLSFDYRVYDGHCQVYGCCEGEINYELFRQFINWLCSEYPLRKIFLQVIKKEFDLIQLARKLGFVEEACLKEYKYVDGQYVDMLLFSYFPRSDKNGI